MKNLFVLAGAVATAPGALAHAQVPAAAPQSSAQPSAQTVESVVITAQRPATTTTIDRKIYAVDHDLQASAGSVGDVLRNLPSVEVDVLGNVSLRGDTNIQVLIDGKPSTMMSAANRGAILEQMPADAIASIEVITNPSAQYKPDGASGVINIVTKKNRKPGRSGTAQASLGSEGRYNLGASAAYNTDRLNLTASASLRHETRKRTVTDHRVRHAPGGDAPSDQTIVSTQQRASKIASVGFDFDADPKTRVSGGYSYSRRDETLRVAERDTASAPNGAVASDYDRLGRGKGHETSTQASLGYRRTFDDKGELSIDLQRGQTQEDRRRVYLSTYRTPITPPLTEDLIPRADELTNELTIEYARPLPGKADLKLGYDLEQDRDDYDNYGGVIVGGVSIADPAQTNRFVYKQTVQAFYGTYGRPIGAWTLLAGLRLEETKIDTNQITSALKNSTNYFRAYPTLHLEREVGQDGKLRLSYSRRVARPDPEDLNPYAVYQDAFNYRAGNPALMPQETDAFEVGYETRALGATLAATVYARRNRNGVTDVSRYVTPLILLTTKENLGKSNATGLELSATGKLSSKLAYNLSSNIFHSQIDAGNLGFVARRSGTGFTGKASLDYTLSAKDLLQISANYSGRRLTAQGYRLPNGSVNLGYRRKISDRLAAVFTLADAFDTAREGAVIDTATLNDRYERRQLGRTAFVSLSWKFGAGGKAKDPGFDYSPAP